MAGLCVATADGLAQDFLAHMIGCPDCPGMTPLKASNPSYYTICYWIKRPKGKILVLGGLAAILYFVFKK